MPVNRKWVVELLYRLGYRQAADEAGRVLPDPVDIEQVIEFGRRYGISRSELVDRMGGSS